MKNVAGVVGVTTTNLLIQELTEARVKIMRIAPKYGAVKTEVRGMLVLDSACVEFDRMPCYWRVEVNVAPPLAELLYFNQAWAVEARYMGVPEGLIEDADMTHAYLTNEGNTVWHVESQQALNALVVALGEWFSPEREGK